MSSTIPDKTSVLSLYKKVFRQYINFNGRARRKEYWTFALINTAIFLGLWVFLLMLKLIPGIGPILAEIISFSLMFFLMAIFLPSAAVTVRRLQDDDTDWYLIFLILVPIANFYILYLLLEPGQVGDNRFGPDPKAAEWQKMKTPPSF